MKRILEVLLLVVLYVSSGQLVAAEGPSPDTVLVRVGSHEIRVLDLGLSSVLLREAAATMSPDAVQDLVVSHLIDTYLLADAARAAGVEDDVAALAAATVGDAVAPARAGESAGLREVRLNYLKNAALAESYLRRFDRTVDLSEEVLRARYAELAKADEVHLRYIAALTQDLASAARQRVASGESFEAVASAMSLDTDTARKGGDLGWLQRRLLTREFANAVASVKPGDSSQPFQTAMGWNVLQLVETRPMKIKPYMKAHDALKAEVLAGARSLRTADLRKAGAIEWYTRRPPAFEAPPN